MEYTYKALLAVYFMLVSRLVCSSTLKCEAIFSSEMSVAFPRTTGRHIPEDRTLHNIRCENLKSYINFHSHSWS
jgi:hypothetical protein